MKLYNVDIYLNDGTVCRDSCLPSITKARQRAEGCGNTARKAIIYRRYENLRQVPVAMHVRDTNGNGMRWFKATCGD